MKKSVMTLQLNALPGKKAVEERENANMKFIRLIYKKLVDNEVT